MNQQQTPQVLFLYGPAGCGKGTQAFALLEQFPFYEYIEVGEVLRQFAKEYSALEGIEGDIARKVEGEMHKGLAINFENWKFIWNLMITPKLKTGTHILIDGVFREYHQSMFLAQSIADLETSVALFVIHISVEEAIKRLSTRFYAPGSRKPYTSYEEAKANSPEGQEPTSRSDDQNPETIRARYRNQYEFQFGRCVSIYQRVTAGELYVIDGEQPVDEVTSQIIQNLANFAKKSSRLSI